MFTTNFSICLVIVVTVLQGIEGQVESVRQRKSKEMLQYMKLSTDPCDDFYEFTCGNYNKYHKVDRDSQPVIGSMDILNYAMEAKFKQVLESKDETSNTKDDLKVKSYYRSCLRAPKLKSLYRFKLWKLIEEIGFMPLLGTSNWLEDEFDWSETVAKIFYSSGIPVLVQVEVDTDYLDYAVNRVYLTQALTKPKNFYNNISKNFHAKYIIDIAENMHNFLGVKISVATEIAKEMFEFEKALSEGMSDERSEQQLTQLYPEISVENLTRQYFPHWNVKTFLGIALGKHPNLIYAQQSYLDVVLQTVANTPKYIVANYIFYTFIRKFFYPQKDLKRKLQKSCIKDAKHYFYKNLDNMIYRKFFKPQAKEDIYAMWQEIKETFAATLQKPRLSWINEKTRLYAINKLNSMRLHIATYEDLDNVEEFSHLHFKTHDYINNKKSILGYQASQLRAKLQRQPKLEDNLEEIASLTPMYMAAGNFVSVPVSYLLPGYAWSSSYPTAYNFANLGFSLAHELMHAFDDSGRYYDAKGVYLDWWDNKSAKTFEERIQCLTKQYKEYSISGQSVPEMKIQSENIADNGGIRLAYSTYLKWLESSSKLNLQQESLPGLNFKNKQLFFISYGQMWCSVLHPDYLTSQLSSDSHVPDKLRVIGPLSNLEDFSKEFQCPKGSAMNPLSKCSIY